MLKVAYSTVGLVTSEHAADRVVADWQTLGISKVHLLAKACSVMTCRSEIARSIVSDLDAFGLLVRKARDAGIEIHAWFKVYPEIPKDPADIVKEHPECLLVNRHGKSNIEEPTWSGDGGGIYWACPGSRIYRDYLLSLMEEVIDRYDVDGIHLDFIRYPEEVEARFYCQCDECREKYKQKYGFEFPNDSGVKHRYWATVMCENVSESVEEFSALTRRKGKQISAYVFMDYTTAVEAVYQDWPYFSRYLDMLHPSVYEVSPSHIRTLITRAKMVVGDRCSILPAVCTVDKVWRGLDGGDRWSQDTSVNYLYEATKAAMESGADGICFYIYEALFGKGVFDCGGKAMPEGTVPRLREMLRDLE